MKYLLYFSLLISAQAFAIDFSKVTGTFDVGDKATAREESASLAYGSFEPASDSSRLPASVEEKAEKPRSTVNEISGTFE